MHDQPLMPYLPEAGAALAGCMVLAFILGLFKWRKGCKWPAN